MQSGIYKIICLKNNKAYIGQSENISQRQNSHFSHLRCNTHTNKLLQSDYNEYGGENFVFEVIEYCESISEIMNEKETFYIRLQKDLIYNHKKKGDYTSRKINTIAEKNKIEKEKLFNIERQYLIYLIASLLMNSKLSNKELSIIIENTEKDMNNLKNLL